MARNVLQIAQDFASRTGVKYPNALVSSTDTQLRQVLGLLHEELEELLTGAVLQASVKEFTFVAAAAEDQGALETLCGEPVKSILNDILWNRTTRLPIFGPLSAQNWQLQKAYGITGPLTQYRIRGDRLLTLPNPTAGNTIAGEFVRKYCVVASGGTAPTKTRFDADSDTCIFPEELLTAGLRWRWKREKGLTYAEDKARWQQMRDDYTVKTGTKRQLSLGGNEDSMQPRPAIVVPAGNWPL